MSYEIIDGRVYEVRYVQTRTQVAVVKTEVDMLYHTELSLEGSNLVVVVKDYLNNPAAEYQEPISIQINDETVTVDQVEGIATLPLTSAGEYVVRTVNPDIRNSELTFTI